MAARVELVRCGGRIQTSCSDEQTCVGATNALTNLASQAKPVICWIQKIAAENQNIVLLDIEFEMKCI